MTRVSLRNLPAELDLNGLTVELARWAGAVDTERRAPVEGLAALKARGLFGALIPRQYGGLDLTPAELFIAGEAIAAGCGATGLIWGQHLAATAFIARFGNARTRALLPEAATGARHFAIGVGYTSRPESPVQAWHVNGRVLFSGTATWMTGSAVMTDALISAQDRSQDGRTLMGIAPRDLLTVHPPYQMMVVTGGMNADVSFSDVDVTDTLLDLPPQRTAISAVFTQNKAPRDGGFHAGLTRAMLDLCRTARALEPAALDALARVEAAAAGARAAMLDWLDGRAYEDVDVPPFWNRYHRIAQLLLEAAGLVTSAGGSHGLLDGTAYNRLYREAGYYLARISARAWFPETAGHVQRWGEPGT